MGVEQTIAEIERLERIFVVPRHETAERKRPCGCQS
jgi:hypothetical protein